MPPPDSCSVLTADPALQQLWETYTGCRSTTASPPKSRLWCTKLFIFAVHRTWLTSSFSAQPTLIGSSAPLRPEEPRYRELGPSSDDGPFLSAVPTCGTVFLHLSVPSTPTRPSAMLSKLICSSLLLTINCFYFLFYHFWLCNAGFYLVWPGTIIFLSYHMVIKTYVHAVLIQAWKWPVGMCTHYKPAGRFHNGPDFDFIRCNKFML